MVRETRYLLVANLPVKTTEDEITEYFKRHGKIQSVKIHGQKDENASSATVAFTDIKSASKAHNAENKIESNLLRTEYSEGSATGKVVKRTQGTTAFPHAPHGSGTYSTRTKGSEEGESNYDRDYHYADEAPQFDGRFQQPGYSEEGPFTARGRTRERTFSKGILSKQYDRIAHHQQKTQGKRHGESRRPTDQFPSDKEGLEKSKNSGSSPHLSHHSGSKPHKSHSHSRSRSHSRSSSSSSGSGSSSSSSQSGSNSSHSSSHSNVHHNQPASIAQKPLRTDTQGSVSSGKTEATDSQGSSGDRHSLGICVTCLPLRSSDTSLRDGLFHEYKKYGKVTAVHVAGQDDTRFAIVSFRMPEDAKKAMEASHNKMFFGRQIKVTAHEGIEVDDNEFRPPESELHEHHPKATRTLFVGNLEKEITSQELKEKLGEFGEIIDVDIKRQGAISAYAFVQFSDITCVVKVLRQMEGEHIGPSKVKLGFGKSMATNCVWLDNLANCVTDKFLCYQFSRFGSVSHAVVDHIRGKALVYFNSIESAQFAVNDMRNRIWGGKKIHIDFGSRDCQSAFFDKMEKTGQLQPGERPDERSSWSQRINQSVWEERSEKRAGTFTKQFGTSNRSRSFNRSKWGGYLRGRDRGFKEGYHQEFGTRRQRSVEEFRQSSNSSCHEEDSYLQELREFGDSQRERRERGNPSPGGHFEEEFYDERSHSLHPSREREYGHDIYEYKESYSSYDGDESPTSERGSTFCDDNRYNKFYKEKYSSVMESKSKMQSRDHSIESEVRHVMSPEKHRSGSRSPAHGDRRTKETLRSQTPPTPTEEEAGILSHDQSPMEYESPHRKYGDYKRKVCKVDDILLGSESDRNSVRVGLLNISTPVSRNSAKKNSKPEEKTVRKRSYEEMVFSQKDTSQSEDSVKKTDRQSSHGRTNVRYDSDKIAEVKKELFRIRADIADRTNLLSCLVNSPGSASHGDSSQSTLTESELLKLHQEKKLLQERLKHLEDGINVSDTESVPYNEDTRKVITKKHKFNLTNWNSKLSFKTTGHKTGSGPLLKSDIHVSDKLQAIDTSQSFRKQMEALRKIEENKLKSATTSKVATKVKTDILGESEDENSGMLSPKDISSFKPKKRRKADVAYRVRTGNDSNNHSSGDEKAHTANCNKADPVIARALRRQSSSHSHHSDTSRSPRSVFATPDAHSDSSRISEFDFGHLLSGKEEINRPSSSLQENIGRENSHSHLYREDSIQIIPCGDDSPDTDLKDPRHGIELDDPFLLALPKFAQLSRISSPPSSPLPHASPKLSLPDLVKNSPCFSPQSSSSKTQSPMTSPSGSESTDFRKSIDMPDLTEQLIFTDHSVPHTKTTPEDKPIQSSDFESESDANSEFNDFSESPDKLSLEERIRRLDEKLEKSSNVPPSKSLDTITTSAGTVQLALYSKFKIRKRHDPSVSEQGDSKSEPSDIVKTLLSKKSIFDQDSKRLQQINEKYEPKEVNLNLNDSPCTSMMIRTKAATKQMPLTTLPGSLIGRLGGYPTFPTLTVNTSMCTRPSLIPITPAQLISPLANKTQEMSSSCAEPILASEASTRLLAVSGIQSEDLEIKLPVPSLAARKIAEQLKSLEPPNLICQSDFLGVSAKNLSPNYSMLKCNDSISSTGSGSVTSPQMPSITGVKNMSNLDPCLIDSKNEIADMTEDAINPLATVPKENDLFEMVSPPSQGKRKMEEVDYKDKKDNEKHRLENKAIHNNQSSSHVTGSSSAKLAQSSDKGVKALKSDPSCFEPEPKKPKLSKDKKSEWSNKDEETSEKKERKAEKKEKHCDRKDETKEPDKKNKHITTKQKSPDKKQSKSVCKSERKNVSNEKKMEHSGHKKKSKPTKLDIDSKKEKPKDDYGDKSKQEHKSHSSNLDMLHKVKPEKNKMKHKEADFKPVDGKHSENKQLDSKHLDSKHSDKHPNSKHSDKHFDSKHSDGKHLDNKHLDKHLDDKHLDKHLDSKNSDSKHLDGKHSDKQSDSKHSDKHLDGKHSNKHLDSKHSDKHLDGKHLDKHLDSKHLDKQSNRKHSDKHLESKLSDKHSESKHSDKPSDSKHSDKQSDSKHSDKQSDSKHSDKQSDSKHSDKQSDSKHSDKQSDSKHSDKQSDSKHSDKQSDSKHSDKQSDSKHSDKQSDSKHSDKQSDSKHSDKQSDSKHSDKQSDSKHSDKQSDSKHSDKQSDSKHSDKQSDSKHSDKQSDNKHSDKQSDSKHSDKQSDSKHSDKQSDSKHSDKQSDSKHSDKQSDSKHSDKQSDSKHSDKQSDSKHSDKQSDSKHSDKQSDSRHSDKHSDNKHSDKQSDNNHSDKQSESKHSDSKHFDSKFSDKQLDSKLSDKQSVSKHSDKHSETKQSDSKHLDSKYIEDRSESKCSDSKFCDSKNEKKSETKQVGVTGDSKTESKHSDCKYSVSNTRVLKCDVKHSENKSETKHKRKEKLPDSKKATDLKKKKDTTYNESLKHHSPDHPKLNRKSTKSECDKSYKVKKNPKKDSSDKKKFKKKTKSEKRLLFDDKIIEPYVSMYDKVKRRSNEKDKERELEDVRKKLNRLQQSRRKKKLSMSDDIDTSDDGSETSVSTTTSRQYNHNKDDCKKRKNTVIESSSDEDILQMSFEGIAKCVKSDILQKQTAKKAKKYSDIYSSDSEEDEINSLLSDSCDELLPKVSSPKPKKSKSIKKDISDSFSIQSKSKNKRIYDMVKMHEKVKLGPKKRGRKPKDKNTEIDILEHMTDDEDFSFIYSDKPKTPKHKKTTLKAKLNKEEKPTAKKSMVIFSSSDDDEILKIEIKPQKPSPKKRLSKSESRTDEKTERETDGNQMTCSEHSRKPVNKDEIKDISPDKVPVDDTDKSHTSTEMVMELKSMENFVLNAGRPEKGKDKNKKKNKKKKDKDTKSANIESALEKEDEDVCLGEKIDLKHESRDSTGLFEKMAGLVENLSIEKMPVSVDEGHAVSDPIFIHKVNFLDQHLKRMNKIDLPHTKQKSRKENKKLKVKEEDFKFDIKKAMEEVTLDSMLTFNKKKTIPECSQVDQEPEVKKVKQNYPFVAKQIKIGNESDGVCEIEAAELTVQTTDNSESTKFFTAIVGNDEKDTGAVDVGSDEIKDTGAVDVGSDEIKDTGAVDVGSDEIKGTGAVDMESDGIKDTGSVDMRNDEIKGTAAVDVGNDEIKGTGAVDMGNDEIKGTGAVDVGNDGIKDTGAIDMGNDEIKDTGAIDMGNDEIKDTGAVDMGNDEIKATGAVDMGNDEIKGTGAVDMGNDEIKATGAVDMGNDEIKATGAVDMGNDEIKGTGAVDVGNDEIKATGAVDMESDGIKDTGSVDMRNDEIKGTAAVDVVNDEIKDTGAVDMGNDEIKATGAVDMGNDEIKDTGAVDMESDGIKDTGSVDVGNDKIKDTGAIDVGNDEIKETGAVDVGSDKIKDIGTVDVGSDKIKDIGTVDVGSDKIKDTGAVDVGNDEIKGTVDVGNDEIKDTVDVGNDGIKDIGTIDAGNDGIKDTGVIDVGNDGIKDTGAVDVGNDEIKDTGAIDMGNYEIKDTGAIVVGNDEIKDTGAVDVGNDEIKDAVVVGNDEIKDTGAVGVGNDRIKDTGAVDMGNDKIKDTGAVDVGNDRIKDTGAVNVGNDKIKDTDAIDVGSDKIKDTSAVDMGNDKRKDIRTVDLGSDKIKDTSAVDMGNDKIKDIHTIDVGSDGIKDTGAVDVGNDKIKEIDTVDVGNDGIKDIGALDVENDKIKDTGAVDVGNDEIKDTGAVDVGNDRIKDTGAVDVGSDKIKDTGAVDVVNDGIKDTGAVDMGNDEIKDTGAIDVGNDGIKDIGTVDMGSDKIKDTGAVDVGNDGIKGTGAVDVENGGMKDTGAVDVGTGNRKTDVDVENDEIKDTHVEFPNNPAIKQPSFEEISEEETVLSAVMVEEFIVKIGNAQKPTKNAKSKEKMKKSKKKEKLCDIQDDKPVSIDEIFKLEKFEIEEKEKKHKKQEEFMELAKSDLVNGEDCKVNSVMDTITAVIQQSAVADEWEKNSAPQKAADVFEFKEEDEEELAPCILHANRFRKMEHEQHKTPKHDLTNKEELVPSHCDKKVKSYCMDAQLGPLNIIDKEFSEQKDDSFSDRLPSLEKITELADHTGDKHKELEIEKIKRRRSRKDSSKSIEQRDSKLDDTFPVPVLTSFANVLKDDRSTEKAPDSKSMKDDASADVTKAAVFSLKNISSLKFQLTSPLHKPPLMEAKLEIVEVNEVVPEQVQHETATAIESILPSDDKSSYIAESEQQSAVLQITEPPRNKSLLISKAGNNTIDTDSQEIPEAEAANLKNLQVIKTGSTETTKSDNFPQHHEVEPLSTEENHQQIRESGSSTEVNIEQIHKESKLPAPVTESIGELPVAEEEELKPEVKITEHVTSTTSQVNECETRDHEKETKEKIAITQKRDIVGLFDLIKKEDNKHQIESVQENELSAFKHETTEEKSPIEKLQEEPGPEPYSIIQEPLPVPPTPKTPTRFKRGRGRRPRPVSRYERKVISGTLFSGSEYPTEPDVNLEAEKGEEKIANTNTSEEIVTPSMAPSEKSEDMCSSVTSMEISNQNIPFYASEPVFSDVRDLETELESKVEPIVPTEMELKKIGNKTSVPSQNECRAMDIGQETSVINLYLESDDDQDGEPGKLQIVLESPTKDEDKRPKCQTRSAKKTKKPFSPGTSKVRANLRTRSSEGKVKTETTEKTGDTSCVRSLRSRLVADTEAKPKRQSLVSKRNLKEPLKLRIEAAMIDTYSDKTDNDQASASAEELSAGESVFSPERKRFSRRGRKPKNYKEMNSGIVPRTSSPRSRTSPRSPRSTTTSPKQSSSPVSQTSPKSQEMSSPVVKIERMSVVCRNMKMDNDHTSDTGRETRRTRQGYVASIVQREGRQDDTVNIANKVADEDKPEESVQHDQSTLTETPSQTETQNVARDLSHIFDFEGDESNEEPPQIKLRPKRSRVLGEMISNTEKSDPLTENLPVSTNIEFKSTLRSPEQKYSASTSHNNHKPLLLLHLEKKTLNRSHQEMAKSLQVKAKPISAPIFPSELVESPKKETSSIVQEKHNSEGHEYQTKKIAKKERVTEMKDLQITKPDDILRPPVFTHWPTDAVTSSSPTYKSSVKPDETVTSTLSPITPATPVTTFTPMSTIERIIDEVSRGDFDPERAQVPGPTRKKMPRNHSWNNEEKDKSGKDAIGEPTIIHPGTGVIDQTAHQSIVHRFPVSSQPQLSPASLPPNILSHQSVPRSVTLHQTSANFTWTAAAQQHNILSSSHVVAPSPDGLQQQTGNSSFADTGLKRYPKDMLHASRPMHSSQPMSTHMSAVKNTSFTAPIVTTAMCGMTTSSSVITQPISLPPVSNAHHGQHMVSLASHQQQPLQLTTSSHNNQDQSNSLHNKQDASSKLQVHIQPHSQAGLIGQAKVLITGSPLRSGAVSEHPAHMAGQIHLQAAHNQQSPAIVQHCMSHPNKPLPSPLPQPHPHPEQYCRPSNHSEGTPRRPPSAHSQQSLQPHDPLPPRPSSSHEPLVQHFSNVQEDMTQFLHSPLSPHGHTPSVAHSHTWQQSLNVSKPEDKLEQLLRCEKRSSGSNNPVSNSLHLSTGQVASEVCHGSVVSQAGGGLPRTPSPAMLKGVERQVTPTSRWTANEQDVRRGAILSDRSRREMHLGSQNQAIGEVPRDVHQQVSCHQLPPESAQQKDSKGSKDIRNVLKEPNRYLQQQQREQQELKHKQEVLLHRQQEMQRQEIQRQQMAKQREQEQGQQNPTSQREESPLQCSPSSGQQNLHQPPVSAVGQHRVSYTLADTRVVHNNTKSSQGQSTVNSRYLQSHGHPGQSYSLEHRHGNNSVFAGSPGTGEVPQGVEAHLYSPADMRIHQSDVPYPIRMPHLPVDVLYQQQHAQYMAAKEHGLLSAVTHLPQHYLVEHPGLAEEHQHLVDGRLSSQGASRPPSQGSQHGGSVTPSTTHSPFSTPEPQIAQSGMVASHMADIPPTDSSLLSLLQRYPVMWQGVLALKNDQCVVQMHFISGLQQLVKPSLPQPVNRIVQPLRIAQRMRLEHTQLEGVAKRMQMEKDYCMLLALPCGQDHTDIYQQTRFMSSGFIQYLQQKQAAGIVNVPDPITQQPAYVVHIFPPCEFSQITMEKLGFDLLHQVKDLGHLLIIIATVG